MGRRGPVPHKYRGARSCKGEPNIFLQTEGWGSEQKKGVAKTENPEIYGKGGGRLISLLPALTQPQKTCIRKRCFLILT